MHDRSSSSTERDGDEAERQGAAVDHALFALVPCRVPGAMAFGQQHVSGLSGSRRTGVLPLSTQGPHHQALDVARYDSS